MTPKQENAIHEVRQANGCLYIEVAESIAKDVQARCEKLIAVLQETENERAKLEAAAQLALDWATGQGQFANGKDTIPGLADVVAPALEMALTKPQ